MRGILWEVRLKNNITKEAGQARNVFGGIVLRKGSEKGATTRRTRKQDGRTKSDRCVDRTRTLRRRGRKKTREGTTVAKKTYRRDTLATPGPTQETRGRNQARIDKNGAGCRNHSKVGRKNCLGLETPQTLPELRL